jgi:hypothetical protein
MPARRQIVGFLKDAGMLVVLHGETPDTRF